MDPKQHLNDLYYLVRVVDAGSFAAAARELGTTRSLLSRRIIALEKALNARLLIRDSRHFTVTRTGEQVYKQAVLMSDAADAAIATAHAAAAGDRGPLQVALDAVLWPLLQTALADFANHHPHIQLATRTYCGHDGAPVQHADITLHAGQLVSSDDISVHPLGQARLVIVASPTLLRQLGEPQSPAEIGLQHRLVYSGATAQWQLREKQAKLQHRQPRLVSDRIAVLLAAARAGTGFAQLPLHACHEAIASGHLQIVCEAFEPEPLPLHALTPAQPAQPAPGKKQTDFIDFVREQLANRQAQGVFPIDS